MRQVRVEWCRTGKSQRVFGEIADSVDRQRQQGLARGVNAPSRGRDVNVSNRLTATDGGGGSAHVNAVEEVDVQGHRVGPNFCIVDAGDIRPRLKQLVDPVSADSAHTIVTRI